MNAQHCLLKHFFCGMLQIVCESKGKAKILMIFLVLFSRRQELSKLSIATVTDLQATARFKTTFTALMITKLDGKTMFMNVAYIFWLCFDIIVVGSCLHMFSCLVVLACLVFFSFFNLFIKIQNNRNL